MGVWVQVSGLKVEDLQRGFGFELRNVGAARPCAKLCLAGLRESLC